jgi:hypothetical protein
VNEPNTGSGSVFLFQQVAVERERLMKGKNWKDVADRQLKEVFTMTDKTDKDLHRLVDLYTEDFSENISE